MDKQTTANLASGDGPSQSGDVASSRDSKPPCASVHAHYVVVSVEQAPVPDGGQGTDWCRYVLSCGTSRITGLHRGSIDEVMAFAESCAEGFNLRSATGKGKAGVAYTKKTALIPAAR